MNRSPRTQAVQALSPALMTRALHILIYIAIFLAAGLFVSTFAQAPTQEPEGLEGDYVPNEVVVKYKADVTPQELQLIVEERTARQSSLIGSIQLFFENLGYKLQNQDTPEQQLTRLQQADEAVGALNKTRIFNAEDENQRNLFLIETTGEKSVEMMINTYEALPEVEYAEPNYLFTTFGLE